MVALHAYSTCLIYLWRAGKWHLVRFCRQSLYTFTKYSNPGGILIGAKERFSFTKKKTTKNKETNKQKALLAAAFLFSLHYSCTYISH